jgi:membrane-associated phospholipid phosphatase
MHYPSDIAAGYLVAIFWIGAVTALRAGDKP